MKAAEVVEQIETTQKVLIIEDLRPMMRVMERAVTGLNPEITVYKATTLGEAREYEDRVDENTVVLSDYSFPSKKGEDPLPNASQTHEMFGKKCKLFAITTSHPILPPEDNYLEVYRLDKDEFLQTARSFRLANLKKRSGMLSTGTVKGPNGTQNKNDPPKIRQKH